MAQHSATTSARVQRILTALALAFTPFFGACHTTHSHATAQTDSPTGSSKEDKERELRRRKEIDRHTDRSEPIPPAQPGVPRAPEIPPFTPKPNTPPAAPNVPAPTSTAK